jgi:type VI secretion system protein ImpF
MPDSTPAGRAAANDTYVPSILDRLIAPDSAGSGPSLGFRLPDLVEGVRRDLEDLLNTRQTHAGLPEEFVELHHSIVAYGLPDFATLDATKQKVRQRIGALVEAIVNRFEPRLRDVKATPVDTINDERQTLSVRVLIDARLRVEPYPDVSFESVIELMSGQASIRPRDYRGE